MWVHKLLEQYRDRLSFLFKQLGGVQKKPAVECQHRTYDRPADSSVLRVVFGYPLFIAGSPFIRAFAAMSWLHSAEGRSVARGRIASLSPWFLPLIFVFAFFFSAGAPSSRLSHRLIGLRATANLLSSRSETVPEFFSRFQPKNRMASPQTTECHKAEAMSWQVSSTRFTILKQKKKQTTPPAEDTLPSGLTCLFAQISSIGPLL